MSFAIAVLLAAWMRSEDFGWGASLIAAGVTYVILPFIISQAYAASILARANWRLRNLDALITPDNLRAEARRLRAAGNNELADDFELAAGAIESGGKKLG